MNDVLLPQTVTIIRRGSVTYPQTGANRGRPVAAEPSTFELLAAVQPLNGIERSNAPEGKRSLRSIKLYADNSTPLVTEAVAGATQADIVVYAGVQFVIFDAIPYDDPSSSSPHIKYTAYASDTARAIPVPYVEPAP